MSFGIGAGSFGADGFGVKLGGVSSGTGSPPTAGLRIFIAGVEYSGRVRPYSFGVDADVGSRDTMGFGLVDMSLGIHFQTGENVEAYIDGVKVFGGSVERVRESIPEGAKFMNVTVSCVDRNAIADKHIVTNRFNRGFTLRQVALAIWSKYSGEIGETLQSDGVIASDSTVEEGPVLGTIIFEDKTVAYAFDKLAELSGLVWEIDYDNVLHFFDPMKFVAPKPLDPVFWRSFTGLTVERKIDKYRNAQTIIGGTTETDPMTQIETFTGDGETTTFPLSLEVVVPNESDGIILLATPIPPKVEEDRGSGFVQKTVGVEKKDENKDWYYQTGEKDISQDDAGTKLTSAHKLRVTYTGRFPVKVKARDEDEIRRRKEIEGQSAAHVSGVTEEVESHENVNDLQLAEDLATALLRRNAHIADRVRFETFLPGFRPGQLLPANLPDHQIQTDCLIDSVSISRSHTGQGDVEVYKYEVTAIEGEQLGGWSEFFRRWADRGRPLSFSENSTILVVRKAAEVIKISDVIGTADALGSFLLDKASVRMVGSPWVGYIHQRSFTDAAPEYITGPACRLPEYAEVS